jgi:hypothetical protein
LPTFESDSEDDEGSYWFSLQESNREDDDDDFEDKCSSKLQTVDKAESTITVSVILMLIVMSIVTQILCLWGRKLLTDTLVNPIYGGDTLIDALKVEEIIYNFIVCHLRKSYSFILFSFHLRTVTSNVTLINFNIYIYIYQPDIHLIFEATIIRYLLLALQTTR